MRKQLTVILLSALMLSGCASGRMGNPGAIVGGAAIGGSLGSSEIIIVAGGADIAALPLEILLAPLPVQR